MADEKEVEKTELEEKYGYSGADTKIVVLAEAIDVPVGAAAASFGVAGAHEVLDLEEGGEVHVVSATVPKSLADEMVKAKRAHLRSSLKIKPAKKKAD